MAAGLAGSAKHRNSWMAGRARLGRGPIRTMALGLEEKVEILS